ncbi:MAG: hypothetical protein K2J73_04405 [Oscillospiraceae bacterium]|nr:hypothetical protein [Oscillospiraceae bacterium]
MRFGMKTIIVIIGVFCFGFGVFFAVFGAILFSDPLEDDFSKYIMVGFGAVFAIIGASMLLSVILKAVRRKRLMANGDQLTGIITAVNINMSVTVNGYHPYRADCEVFDPDSGERYLYRSENTMEDISGLVGMSVTVYADHDNRKKYYVDIASLADSYRTENKINDYR